MYVGVHDSLSIIIIIIIMDTWKDIESTLWLLIPCLVTQSSLVKVFDF